MSFAARVASVLQYEIRVNFLVDTFLNFDLPSICVSEFNVLRKCCCSQARPSMWWLRAAGIRRRRRRHLPRSGRQNVVAEIRMEHAALSIRAGINCAWASRPRWPAAGPSR